MKREEQKPTKLTLYQYEGEGKQLVSIHALTSWECYVVCEMTLERFIELVKSEPKLGIGRGKLSIHDAREMLNNIKDLGL